MKTNHNLIQFLLDNSLEKEYAFFLKLKHIHVNGKIYNYSLKKLSKQSGLSRTALRVKMYFFKENGWVREEGKDLVFISHNKLMSKLGVDGSVDYKMTVRGDKIKNLVNTIRFQPIKLKGRQFSHLKYQSHNLNNPTGGYAHQEHTASKAFFRKYQTKSEVTEGLKITTKRLGQMINKSASTASRLMKIMDVKVIAGKKTVAKSKRLKGLPSNFYWNKGFIVRVEPNQYIF